MNILKKINIALFKFSILKLPSYLNSKSANKIKNYFAKKVLIDIGKNINWGKSIHMSLDIKIGDDSGIGNNAFLNGPISIGRDVMMGANVTVFRRNHKSNRIDIPMRLQGMDDAEELIIEDDVWIGNDVTILPKVKRIGHGSIIGARAVVFNDVPSMSVVVGNPGKIVRKRENYG